MKAQKEVQVTFRIEEQLALELDRLVASGRTTRSWLIREALHKYLQQEQPPEEGKTP